MRKRPRAHPVVELELALLTPAARRSGAGLGARLHPDLREVGVTDPGGRAARRRSLWLGRRRWRMLHHQGTPLLASELDECAPTAGAP